MSRGRSSASLVLMLLTIYLIPGISHAVVNECANNSKRLEQSFSSGAAWTVCARIDDQHALDISSVYYRAPGDSLRSVLSNVHVAQILLHYHDQSTAQPQVGVSTNSRLLDMTALNCDGTRILDDGEGAKLCSRIEDNRTLAKYAQRPSLQSQRWELSAAMQRGGLIWAVSINFDEDGRITPGVSLSGRARTIPHTTTAGNTLAGTDAVLARATIVTTWRLVFNLDEGDYDTVQQFDFPLDVAAGNRRAMRVKKFEIEGFSTVERGSFRGWRVVDTSGSGYFLEPFNSGFSYAGGVYEWTSNDVAVTRFHACEIHALHNVADNENDTVCDESLDDFVNGESLANNHPTLWFSQSRTLNPTAEDWPVISNFYQSLTLLPYDWNRASPFEVN